MKTIQITMDERLLQKLDADEETRQHGRSEVLRRAVADYLKRKNKISIGASYRRAYAAEQGLGREFEGWEGEGTWPNE